MQNEIEIWKDVIDYKGFYQISNFGRVKSLSRIIMRNGKYPFLSKEKILKNVLTKRGYYGIILSNNSKIKRKEIHQMMAESFLGYDRNLGHVVDHKDSNKLNNNVRNLRIVTHRFNVSKDKKNKTSKYQGVHYSKASRKWRARIRFKNENIHLGLFVKEEDAKNAYDLKLKQIENDKQCK